MHSVALCVVSYALLGISFFQRFWTSTTGSKDRGLRGTREDGRVGKNRRGKMSHREANEGGGEPGVARNV